MYFFVITGGGSAAIGKMLSKGGASKWFAGAYIPYSKEEIDKYLGYIPEKYNSRDVAMSLAVKVFVDRPLNQGLLVVGCTASLKDESKGTTYPDGTKRVNSAYIEMINYPEQSFCGKYIEFDIEKTRQEQEEELSNILAGIPEGNFIPDISYHGDFTSSQGILFPGSFNPVTKNHLDIATIVWEKTRIKPIFEISIKNFDKDSISFQEAVQRAKKINEKGFPVIIDNKCLFLEKLDILHKNFKAEFIVGYDTLARINNYHTEEELKTFEDRNVKFHVFQRENVEPFINKMYKICEVVPNYTDDGWSSTKEREAAECLGE